jgi:hypothetical protein
MASGWWTLAPADRDGVTVTSGLAGRLSGSARQRVVVIGVVIGVGELLVVTWLALFRHPPDR